MGAAERVDLHGQHKLSNCATAGCAPFQQRWPWIGPDLQTLRDTLRPQRLPPDRGVPLLVPMARGDQLLMLAEQPAGPPPRAWVLLVHGLGGDSGRPGVRRLAQALLAAGFGVLRLNLRGAGAGRALAAGTYAAACNSDLLPVLAAARQRAGDRPLLGVGLSLGGTVLLNALLALPRWPRWPGLRQQSARSGGLFPPDRFAPQPPLPTGVAGRADPPHPGRSPGPALPGGAGRRSFDSPVRRGDHRAALGLPQRGALLPAGLATPGLGRWRGRAPHPAPPCPGRPLGARCCRARPGDPGAAEDQRLPARARRPQRLPWPWRRQLGGLAAWWSG